MLNPPVAEKPAPIPQAVAELWELVVAYFKQETTEPLKSLGRVIGFGIAGSLLLGIGVVFVAIGALRYLQHDLSDTFDGNWTFAPYLIVIVLLLVIAGLVFAIGTRPKKPVTSATSTPAIPSPAATQAADRIPATDRIQATDRVPVPPRPVVPTSPIDLPKDVNP